MIISFFPNTCQPRLGLLALLVAGLLTGGCGSPAPDNPPAARAAEQQEQQDAAPEITADHAADERPFCAGHGVYEDECGICQPQIAANLKPGEGMKVRLPAEDSAALIGIRTALPVRDEVTDGIDCLAEIVYNQNRFARIAAPVRGIVKEVIADLGDRVDENQPVARIWSAAIAETVARAVLSHQTLERERKLRAEGIAPAKDLEAAEAAHRAACQQARTLGFSEAEIDALGTKPDEPIYLEIRAPFAGEIIERTAVRGELVDGGKPLFTVVDRGTMWAMLSVPETAVARLAVGQQVELRVDALPGRTFRGELTWIAAEVDETTRLARARAEIANPDGLLRAHMFARARVLTRQSVNALVVPQAALHQVDETPLVFVRLADDLYEARGVRVGARDNDLVEILEGLAPDEPVVVDQGFTVKSQLLVSRLGVGCAH